MARVCMEAKGSDFNIQLQVFGSTVTVSIESAIAEKIVDEDPSQVEKERHGMNSKNLN